MGKAVLISIRPKWVRLIECGKKTIEVRKTKPKISTPFRCYIYQTLPKSGDWNDRDGRVVGEFICDRIEDMRDVEIEETCLTLDEWRKYTKDHKGIVFGWHISDLVIYDEPKKLSDFKRHDPTYDFSVFGEVCRTYSISRPPQSWCYVEEM